MVRSLVHLPQRYRPFGRGVPCAVAALAAGAYACADPVAAPRPSSPHYFAFCAAGDSAVFDGAGKFVDCVQKVDTIPATIPPAVPPAGPPVDSTSSDSTTPRLVCAPAAVVRGASVSCVVLGRASISTWLFVPDSAAAVLPPVSRSSNANTWAGRMAVSGRVQVTGVTAFGAPLTLAKNVTVAARTFPVMRFPGPPAVTDPERAALNPNTALPPIGTVFRVPGATPGTINSFAASALAVTADAAVDNASLDPSTLLDPITDGGPNAGYALVKATPRLSPAQIDMQPALFGVLPNDPWFRDQNGIDGQGNTIDPVSNVRYCTQQDVTGLVLRAVEAHEGVGVVTAGPTSHVGRWIEVFTTRAPAQRFEQLVFVANVAPDAFRAALTRTWATFVRENVPYVNTALDKQTYDPPSKWYRALGCALDFDLTDKEP